MYYFSKQRKIEDYFYSNFEFEFNLLKNFQKKVVLYQVKNYQFLKSIIHMFNSLMDLKKCWLYSESYNSKKNYFLSINQSKMILK